MPWEGIPPIEVVLGREGIYGIRNGREIPLGAARSLRNATLEDGTYRTAGGAVTLGDAIGSQTNAAIDFWPDPATQRALVSCADGSLRKDNGAGASWVTLASGLTTTSQVPLWVLGGQERLGNSRKAFHYDGVNGVRVLIGDAASMAALTNPPDDWKGTNQPRVGVIHRGYHWGFLAHRAYRSLLDDHEDFLTMSYHLPIYPGVGEYISAALSFKGYCLVWKYPRGAFAIDTRSDAEGAWQVLELGQAGAYGPGNVLLMENDVLWVSPQGTFHLISATDALGSIRATDISARKLGAFFRDNVALTQLATAQWIYYGHKGLAMLACHALGGTTKTRRIEMDVLRVADIGERWAWADRDRNEALFLRKLNGIDTPHFGDASGQIWSMDRLERSTDGSAYTFEWELWDTDFAALRPEWAGRKLNGRYLQLEYDPRSSGSHTISVIKDGETSQDVTFTLEGGPGTLPLTLPFTLGVGVPKRTPQRRLLGQAYRWGFRGRTTDVKDISVIRLILGLEAVA